MLYLYDEIICLYLFPTHVIAKYRRGNDNYLITKSWVHMVRFLTLRINNLLEGRMSLWTWCSFVLFITITLLLARNNGYFSLYKVMPTRKCVNIVSGWKMCFTLHLYFIFFLFQKWRFRYFFCITRKKLKVNITWDVTYVSDAIIFVFFDILTQWALPPPGSWLPKTSLKEPVLVVWS